MPDVKLCNVHVFIFYQKKPGSSTKCSLNFYMFELLKLNIFTPNIFKTYLRYTYTRIFTRGGNVAKQSLITIQWNEISKSLIYLDAYPWDIPQYSSSTRCLPTNIRVCYLTVRFLCNLWFATILPCN